MNLKLLVKVSLMICALAGVVALIKWLQEPSASDQQDQALALLLGSNLKPFNWCGDQVQAVSLFAKNPENSNRKILSPVEQSRVCEIMMGPVKAGMDKGPYKKVAMAETDTGEVNLEVNEQGIFRIDGLPFQSPPLQKVLSELQVD